MGGKGGKVVPNPPSTAGQHVSRPLYQEPSVNNAGYRPQSLANYESSIAPQNLGYGNYWDRGPATDWVSEIQTGLNSPGAKGLVQSGAQSKGMTGTGGIGGKGALAKDMLSPPQYGDSPQDSASAPVRSDVQDPTFQYFSPVESAAPTGGPDVGTSASVPASTPAGAGVEAGMGDVAANVPPPGIQVPWNADWAGSDIDSFRRR